MFKKLALSFFLSLIIFYSSSAVTFGAKPFPELTLPCDKIKDVEFHSLRPYQAALCGDANKALFCSNDLIFTESFDMAGEGDCHNRLTQPGETTFTCKPNYEVAPHNLYVSLDNSDLPILGNTEDVKNSQNSNDTFDDTRKVNEYVSWYLSGVNTRAEYGEPTNKQIVNFSGPLQKLLPQAIAEEQRILTINKVTGAPEDETHNQIVVCAEKALQLSLTLPFVGKVTIGGIGKATQVPCDGGKPPYRLGDWKKDNVAQSWINAAGDTLTKIFPKNIVAEVLKGVTSRWAKREPPLPWNFIDSQEYTKAYNEWRGNFCALLPNPLNGKQKFLVCIGIPGITNNEYADLFPYVPLAVTADKKGEEKIDGVEFVPSSGAKISDEKIAKKIAPPLYFAHTEEVKQLSETLNKTYTPKDVTGEPLPKSTEKNICSVVNVRANAGDDLFPGDPEELQLQKVEYKITEAMCHEVWTRIEIEVCDLRGCRTEMDDKHTLECPTNINIKIKTSTLTPNADEIFSTTVADSASTFRKIYPKVEAGAPVSCIADIPTVTDVTYDAFKKPLISQVPNGGNLSFGVKNYPSDGTNVTPQLTFPHLGSVYEYFLKGIQTALRPKGYGDPSPISGDNCVSAITTADCKGATPQNIAGLINKEDFATMAGPGSRALECYDYVVGRAISEGIDPALAIWVWLNESRASNYGITVHDFGVMAAIFDKDIAGQMGEFIRYKKLLTAANVPECAKYGVTNDLQAFAYIYINGVCDPDLRLPGYQYSAREYYELMVAGIAAMKR